MMSICVGMLYYDSIAVGIFISLSSPIFYKSYINSLVSKEEKNSKSDFKDVLYYMSASVAAGRQMPQAIEDAAKQGDILNPNSIIPKKLSAISNSYQYSNASLIEELNNFAMEMELDEIKLFTDSFEICQSNGGDIENLCLKSSMMIIKSLDYQMEVETILAEKKLDMIILLLMPVVLLFLLNISCSTYLSILYTCKQGRIIMTISLLLMIVAIIWSLKIMNLHL